MFIFVGDLSFSYNIYIHHGLEHIFINIQESYYKTTSLLNGSFPLVCVANSWKQFRKFPAICVYIYNNLIIDSLDPHAIEWLLAMSGSVMSSIIHST